MDFQDITADEAQGFSSNNMAYAMRDHSFHHGYLLRTGAIGHPSNAKFFYYLSLGRSSISSKGCYRSRESAIEAGMKEAKRLKGIADAMHRDEMKRIQMLMK